MPAVLAQSLLPFALLLQSAPAAPPPEPGTDAELEALIPKSAVADPDGWARAAPPDAAAEADQALDPSSPMAGDPGFSLPWPDERLELPALVALEPDPDLAGFLAEDAAPLPAGEPEGDVLRISSRAALIMPGAPASLPMREAIAARFRELSTIERLAGEAGDNPAQLAARARRDGELLRLILRGYGYFDAEIIQTVTSAAPPEVRFQIVPGARYAVGAVSLGDLARTGPDYPALTSAFGVGTGDPVDNEAIVAGRGRLDSELGERGFAFARTGDPELVADHGRETADLSLPVTVGGRYRFGAIASSLPEFLSADHLGDIARFKPGDPFKRSSVEDLRRAIVATGLVSSVAISPREVSAPDGERPGDVALDVTIAKAPLRTLAGEIGYDAGEGFRVEASWEHRNLFPPEGLLRVRAVAGTREKLAGLTFRRNNFHGRDQVLALDLNAASTTREAFVARSVSFSASYEKLNTLIFQKPWVWSAGLELALSNEREGDVAGQRTAASDYYVFALPLRGAFDTTDDLLDPQSGFRLALRVSPEGSISRGRSSFYGRVQADASGYLPLGKRAVLAARVRLGSISGVSLTDIAPSRRFYAGGGGSVRGFGYQEIGPRESLGTPSGGRSLSEFSLEARIGTGLFGGQLSVVPFVDAGTVEPGSIPRLRGMRFGAGLGLRFKTGFGPIRLDVATPIDRRAGESAVAVYVSLGQAF